MNHNDPDWMRWRADKLTAFVRQLNQAIKARQPNAIFSISPNPYHTAYNSYLQDWLTWVRQDLVDELLVQVYRLDLNSFIKEISHPTIREAKQKIPTGIGILTGVKNRKIGMEFIEDKILAARRNNLGVTFFFYNSLWNYAPEPIQQRKSQLHTLFYRPANRQLRLRENIVSPVSPPPVTISPIAEDGIPLEVIPNFSW